MRIRKAIIPAAGLGTRFLPVTKSQPKEMLPIVDKPAIQFIVEEAIESGIEDVLIITGRGKRAIENHFDRSLELESVLAQRGDDVKLKLVQEIAELVDIHYIRQKEPLGLGHAVYCARKFIGDEPFAVLLGDDIIRSEVPCLKQMINIYERFRNTVIGVKQVAPSEVHRYGIVKPGKQWDSLVKVEDLIEKPIREAAPSNLGIMGRYIISPNIFKILQNIQPGAGGEIQLTDALRILCQQEPVYAFQFEGVRYDTGDKLGFLKATVELALQRPELAGEFEQYILYIADRLKKDGVTSNTS